MTNKKKHTLIIISASFFLVSLTQECYTVQAYNSSGVIGLIALLFGWVHFSLIGIIWLASPLYLLSIFFVFWKNKPLTALVLNSLALICCSCFHFVDKVYINEGGTKAAIENLSLGYWLWCISISLLLFTTILNYRSQQRD